MSGDDRSTVHTHPGGRQSRWEPEDWAPGLGRGRLEREFRTMQRMVEIYCADHHVAGGGLLCPDCDEFLHYAERRLEKCPYGEAKPTCARCPIHCYKHTQRELAKEIMRYAGPRMTLRHPYLALMHLVDKLRRVEHPMEIRRRERG